MKLKKHFLWIIFIIHIWIIIQVISQSCAKCNDLNPQTNQQVFTTTLVNTFDISSYTCGQLQLLTSFGGQGLLSCNDDADSIEFTISPTGNAIRVLLGGGSAVVSGSCCDAANPYRVCNAPDTQAGVDELCRNLGYSNAQLTRASSNSCPEVEFNTATQTWTSDFVASAGRLDYLKCSGCSIPNPPNVCSNSPSTSPTTNPTNYPTTIPSVSPTNNPTSTPTNSPSIDPTITPSETPTETPTKTPTKTPTGTPTETPTDTPTITPTLLPSKTPTTLPTTSPTQVPTKTPTSNPTKSPNSDPTSNGAATNSKKVFENNTLTIGIIVIALSLIFCCAVILIACLLLHFRHKKEIEKEKIKAIVSMRSIGMTPVKSVSSPSQAMPTSIHEIDEQMAYLETMRKQLAQDGAGGYMYNNPQQNDINGDKLMAINLGLNEALNNTNTNVLSGEGGPAPNEDELLQNLPHPPEMNDDAMYGNTNDYYMDDDYQGNNDDIYQDIDTRQ